MRLIPILLLLAACSSSPVVVTDDQSIYRVPPFCSVDPESPICQ